MVLRLQSSSRFLKKPAVDRGIVDENQLWISLSFNSFQTSEIPSGYD